MRESSNFKIKIYNAKVATDFWDVRSERRQRPYRERSQGKKT